MRRILEVATKKREKSATTTPRQEENNEEPLATAASFARTAPQAGFLFKFGSNIPEFKRRFFVLKPSTHLYYFLSPADTEPRGCIDLEKATVKPLEQLTDGRFRFQITLQDSRRIILEARSQDVAKQWMESVTVERLDHAQHQIAELRGVNAQYKARIESLEKQVQDFKFMERELDGALEDAANWKSQFERLNEGLRLLTRHLRRPPSTDQGEATECTDDSAKDKENDTQAPIKGKDEQDEENSSGKGNQIDTDVSSSSYENESDVTPQSTNKKLKIETPLNVSHRDTSLLDEIGDDEQQIDDLDFPGTNFSTLLNACQQLRESLRLTSIEASSAVDDLNEANERVAKCEKRMSKAEKHICKLWEENCAMRKTIKQNKAEKRVLVKEVKSLMGVVNATSQKLRDMSALQEIPASRAQNGDGSPTCTPSEEERLIDELEEHVMTSIRLHEQFLGVNNGLADTLLDSVKKIKSGTYAEIDEEESELASRPSSRLSRGTDEESTNAEQRPAKSAIESNAAVVNTSGMGESDQLSPIKPSLLSLLDDDSDEDEASVEDDESTSPSLISSVGAEYGDVYEDLSEYGNQEEASFKTQDISGVVHSQVDRQIPLRLEEAHFSSLATCAEDDRSVSVTSVEVERKHPMLQLDEEIDNDDTAPNLCASSTQSESSKSVVTDNGNATSRLVCPLADVVGAKNNKKVNRDVSEDGKVYHLTFYSRKIGIQFQKVPAEKSSKGLLTDAMTTDLPSSNRSSAGGSSTIASDLERIAAISRLASSSNPNSKTEEVCPVATPIHAVLVCGFHGFVEHPNQPRPKLGARLVAFDGVSVEIGKWTFDSIRKAIHARGRPLTLSFRNDFLTTKQRAILTKAVADVEKVVPPPRPIQYKQSTLRPASRGPGESIVSSQSHETEHFVNDACPLDDSDDLSVSVASSTFPCSFGRSSASMGSYQQNFRSFSDAGSSSIFSSSSTLVGNLMNGLSKHKSKDVPQYLRSDAASLETASHHQDFTSSLL